MADVATLQQDTANNRSQVNVKLYLQVDAGPISYSANSSGSITIDTTNYVFSAGGKWIGSTGKHLIAERTVWVSHNSDGTKNLTVKANYGLNISWGGTWYGQIYLNGSTRLGDIGTYDRMTITVGGAQVTTLSPGDTIRISIEDKGRGVKRSYGYDFDGKVYSLEDNTTKTSGSYTIPISHYTAFPNSYSHPIKFWCNTYDASGRRIGTDAHYLNLVAGPNAKPSIDAVYQSMAGTNGLVADVRASGKYGASISSVSQTMKGITQTGAICTWPISESGTYSVEVTVRDSRGRTETKSYTLTGSVSEPPKIIFFLPGRDKGGQGETVKARISFTADAYPVTVTVERKEKSATTWDSIFVSNVNSAMNTDMVIGDDYDVKKSYDIQLILRDSRGRTVTSVTDISTAQVVMAWGEDNVGIAKIPENNRPLDVGGTGYFKEDVVLNADSQSPISVLKSLENTTITHTQNHWGDSYQFPDGLLICTVSNFMVGGPGSSQRRLISHWYFPTAFASEPTIVVSKDNYTGAAATTETVPGVKAIEPPPKKSWTNAEVIVAAADRINTEWRIFVNLIAIGRWK